jgi:nitrite reductase (NADH) small subunit
MSELKLSEVLAPVAHLSDLPPGEGRAYAVAGRQVAVFRLRDGSVRALDAICPHRGGPLADGLIDGKVVVCPLHGYCYDLVSGAETANGGAPVPVHDVSVDQHGAVSIQLRTG